MLNNDDPDWGALETEMREDQPTCSSNWPVRIFHYFMILLVLTITFFAGGSLIYLLSLSKAIALTETMDVAQQKFIAGGVISVIIVLYVRFIKQS